MLNALNSWVVNVVNAFAIGIWFVRRPVVIHITLLQQIKHLLHCCQVTVLQTILNLSTMLIIIENVKHNVIPCYVDLIKKGDCLQVVPWLRVNNAIHFHIVLSTQSPYQIKPYQALRFHLICFPYLFNNAAR
jgi:hypothetical protein